MTPEEVLLKAADLIERKGWTQYRSAMGSQGQPMLATSTGATRFCALGAIEYVAYQEIPSSRDLSRRMRLRSQSAELLMKHIHNSVSSWNDSYHRTKEEVVQALREAAGKEGTE